MKKEKKKHEGGVHSKHTPLSATYDRSSCNTRPLLPYLKPRLSYLELLHGSLELIVPLGHGHLEVLYLLGLDHAVIGGDLVLGLHLKYDKDMVRSAILIGFINYREGEYVFPKKERKREKGKKKGNKRKKIN